MASTYLTRTFQASNRRTYTFSAWVKRSDITSSYQYLFDCDNGSTQSENPIALNLNKFNFSLWNTSASNAPFTVITNRLLRDMNGWYHLVCAVDTTQATASNRVKLYVNGVQETSLATASYPSQNYDTAINTANVHSIGRWQDGGGRNFGGLMSYVAFVDGQQLTPSTFGETDSTTGEWKIKTTITPGGAGWGTNGFFILKDGNSVTDQSGQGNNWTVGGGTLTKTEDNPSCVFATLNPLVATLSDYTFYNGNTRVHNSNGSTRTIASTIGASTGKYYAEAKIIEMGGNAGDDTTLLVGITDDGYYANNNSTAFGQGSTQVAMAVQRSLIRKNGSNAQTSLTSYSVNDIVSIALDCDNNTVQFYKNGVANGTTTAIDANKTYLFGASGYNGWTLEWNFGNGYFGTTAVATNSGNGYAGAEGSSIFNYQPPTGYSALSTKGLNE